MGSVVAGVGLLTKKLKKCSTQIRVNCICPGTVDTPSVRERMRTMGGEFDTNMARYVARQPIGRLGQASEIADLALYLASDSVSLKYFFPLEDGQNACEVGNAAWRRIAS